MTRRTLVLVPALLLALAALVALLPSGSHLVKDPEDLRAFYCGGQTVVAHRDPYRAQPLGACEEREIRAAGMSPFPGLSLPAPLPAFALVPFGLLGLLNFSTASSLYIILLVAAMASAAILVSRTTGFAPIGTIAALVLSDGLVTILNGQIFPFALLALCACAFELQRGNERRAALYAASAAIEPHVALPVLASLACWLPRTRVPIAASLAALAAVALLAIGIGPNIEYLTQVLPAHARSEAGSGAGQYSLTAVLVLAGIARDRAIEIGNVQYAATCVLGCLVARRVARRYDAPELYAFVPPAFAVLGGPFIHLTQMAVTIPALLALAHRIPKLRDAFGVAAVLMIVPWQDVVENGTIPSLCAVAVVAGIFAYLFWKQNLRAAAAVWLCALALCGAEDAVRMNFPTPRSDPGKAIAAVARPDQLAEVTWEAFIETTEIDKPVRIFALHMPTWLGALMLIVATCAAGASYRQPRIPPAKSR